MKLDTSSYYPASPLDDDPEEEIIVEVEETPVPEKNENSQEEENEKVEKPDEDTGYESEPDRSCPPTTGERIADGFATFLSWVMVPLLMPVYGVLLAFNVSILGFTPMSVKTVFTLVTVAFTVAVPALLVLLLKRMGLVHDVGLNGRKERLIPYIISIVCLVGTGWFMWYKGAPMWLVMFFGGGAVAGLVNLLVNFKWKISAHAAGVAGVVALLIRIIRVGFPQEGAFIWLLVSIALSGLLGTTRVWLGRHTVWQVLAGYAVGFLSVFFMTMI
jgi:hypothetical protein